MGFKQDEQKQHHDKHIKLHCLFPDSSLLVHNYNDNCKWIRRTVLKKLGMITYSVYVGNGCVLKHHIDQLLQHPELPEPPARSESSTMSSPIPDDLSYPDAQDTSPTCNNHESMNMEERRYPRHDHHPPNRFRPLH